MIKTRWRHFRFPLIGIGSAFLIVLLIAIYVMRVTSRELGDLIAFLLISTIPSLLLGYLVFSVGQRHLGSIRWKILLAYGLGAAIALANIYVTSWLMFLNQHDFFLLGTLMIFSGILSISFGFTLAAEMTDSLLSLKAGARRLANGDLSTRVAVPPQDELSEVAAAFNMMAARLEEAFVRQQQLEQARRELIAAVSHDLRTPLASMRAMIEALSDRVVTDEATVARYHRTIQSQVANLSHLIDDLFELSKLDSGRLQLHLEKSNVADLISDTLESMRVHAATKNIRLTGQVASDLPEVSIDSARIQRVLYNLVQNALRHTPADGTVAIYAKPTTEGVRIDITDSGEGIAGEDLPHIFDEFYRSEKSRSRSTGGAGLGLAIARGIIEAHGGRIWVDSQPEQGTTFSLILP
jgi:signal transduction histidine kinase